VAYAREVLAMAGQIRRLKHRAGTMLGRPRREDVLRVLPRHAVGAEIGVFRGEFTEHILRIAAPRELHLIDAWWLLYGDRYPDWGPYTDFGRLRTRDAYEDARRVVSRHSASDICTFHVEDRLLALASFPDDYFDWVYLDASHEYEETLEELELLDSKVRSSGLIAGDDWHEEPDHIHHGLCLAVRDFIEHSRWELVRVDSFCQWCIAGQPR
jgi:hypothetical protein